VAYSAETVANKELADAFSGAPIQAYTEAEATLREAYEHRVGSHGAHDAQALATLHTLAELVKMEDSREGAGLLEECQRGCFAALGVDHPLTLGVMLSLADTYAALGRFADALWLYSAVHSHFAREHGDTHPQTLAVGDRFAAGCVAAGHFARAEHLYTTHLAALEAASADAHGGKEEAEAEEDPAVAPLLAALAEVNVSQGKYAAAEPLLQEGLASRRRLAGDSHPDTFRALHALGSLYAAEGRWGDAKEPLEVRHHKYTHSLTQPLHWDAS